jgi:hypothetical protein
VSTPHKCTLGWWLFAAGFCLPLCWLLGGSPP